MITISNALEAFNIKELKELNSVFSIQKYIPFKTPRFENFIFAVDNNTHFIQHDICHCLTLALDNKINFPTSKFQKLPKAS